MRVDPILAATVLAVVDEGTLDAAARRLHVTPSAVSQRVKTLEEQLGQVLLVRSKPVRATDAGAVVVRLARQFAVLEHDALTALGQESEGNRVRLPIAVNADSLATWFLSPLARVAERGDVEFELYREDQDRTADLLESGTVIAAVTSRAEPVAGCSVTALGACRYDAVATPAYVDRWFPDGVTTDALSRAPMLEFDRNDELQRAWLRGRGAGADGIPRHLVPAAHDFARAVEIGLGWGLLPTPQSARPLAEGGLVRLGGKPVLVSFYWQQWKIRSPVLTALAAEVAAEAARVLLR